MESERGRYAPPAAVIADPAPAFGGPVPASIQIAMSFLGIGVVLEIPTIVIGIGLVQRGDISALILLGAIALLACMCWLIYQISRGRNWARWITLALVAYVLANLVAGIWNMFASWPVELPVRFALRAMWRPLVRSFALNIPAVIILFTAGRAWFRRTD
jgi:hypothetical protein